MLSIHFKVRRKLGGVTLILHGSFRTVLHKIDLEIFYHREWFLVMKSQSHHTGLDRATRLKNLSRLS